MSDVQAKLCELCRTIGVPLRVFAGPVDPALAAEIDSYERELLRVRREQLRVEFEDYVLGLKKYLVLQGVVTPPEEDVHPDHVVGV